MLHRMNKIKLLIIGGVLIVFALSVTQFLSPRQAVSPTLSMATATPEQSTTTKLAVATTMVNIIKHPATNPLPIVDGDTLTSWNFIGAYTNSPELIAKANAEIKRITDFLGKGIYTDTSIYVGIANQYELIGDGKKQYDFLIQAVRAGGIESGLPWHNLGVLMERLGAFKTARVAYEKATLLQPQLSVYQYAYLEFLIRNIKDDTAGIEKAFSAAEASLGNDSYLAYLRDGWGKQ